MNYKRVTDITSEFSILVIGKSGNGKSSLGNALLGEKKFAEGRGMSSTTTTAEYAYANRNRSIKVIDTPDVTNIGLNEDEQHEEVARWRNMVATRPAAVLLTISCEVRYTPEEFAIYKKILKLWGNDSLKDRLVVVFMFGDRLDGTIEAQIAGSSEEMKEVLKDAEETYFVFNKKDEQSRNEALDQVVKVLYERGVSKHSLKHPSEMSITSQTHKPSVSQQVEWPFLVFFALALIILIAGVVLFIQNITEPAIACTAVAVFVFVLIGSCYLARRKHHHSFNL